MSNSSFEEPARKRPRHFHPVHATEPLVQSLVLLEAVCLDVLHFMMGFLALRDLACLARTSHIWQAAEASLNPRSESIYLKPEDQVHITTSLLRRHVTVLDTTKDKALCPKTLCSLSQSMPRITHIRVVMALYGPHTVLQWPTHVRDIVIDHEFDSDSDEDEELPHGSAATLGASLACAHYLECLNINESLPEDCVLAILSPLRASTTLTQVKLTECTSESVAKLLKTFPYLTRIVNWDESNINCERMETVFLDGTDPLPPLTSFPFDDEFDNTYSITSAAKLDLVARQLPALTELKMNLLTSPNQTFTHLFPNVSKLCISFHDDAVIPDAIMLGAFLSRAMHVTDLKLYSYGMTSDDLVIVVSHLTNLKRLSLWMSQNTTSIAFLAHTPSDLTHIILTGEFVVPLTDAHYFERFISLEELDCTRLFSEEPCVYMKARMNYQSPAFDRQRWPKLRCASLCS
jgi:hypothetical protein